MLEKRSPDQGFRGKLGLHSRMCESEAFEAGKASNSRTYTVPSPTSLIHFIQNNSNINSKNKVCADKIT